MIQSTTVICTDLTADRIEFQVGLFGVSMSMDEFKSIANGSIHDPCAVLRNIAINLGLASIDLGDISAINNALAGQTFKVS